MSAATIPAIMRRNDGGEVVVADPFAPDTFHSAGAVNALIKSARERLAMRRAQFDALGDLATADAGAIRALRDAVDGDDETLRDYAARVREALLEMSGFKAFEVQTRGAGGRIDPLSVRGRMGEISDALRAEEERRREPEPVHTYAVTMTLTDSALRKVLTAAKKNGATGVAYAVPQSDAEAQQISDWFTRNA